MNSIDFLAALLTVAVFCYASRPASALVPRYENVNDAANRTLCPYKIEMDEDPKREPQRIKTIKCINPDKTHASPRHHRAHAHAHAHSCSDVRAATQRAQCVELHDIVRVRYGELLTTHDVAVGCACMFLEQSVAQDPMDVLG